jgi:hypothetical protein
MSLTQYAKRRGVSTRAVSKAVATGRLRESVIRVDGAPKIADVELADIEWFENTRPRTDTWRQDGGIAADARAAEISEQRAQLEAVRARREVAEAELAELELHERRSALVAIEDVRREIPQAFAIVRTRILRIVDDIRARHPPQTAILDAAELATVDELIRDALEEVSDEAAEKLPRSFEKGGGP